MTSGWTHCSLLAMRLLRSEAAFAWPEAAEGCVRGTAVVSVGHGATGIGERALGHRHSRHGGPHGSGDSDGIRIVAGATLDAVARRQKGIETLNQFRVAGEQRRHALNNAGSVDANNAVSMLVGIWMMNIRSALEIFHDVQEPVVDVRMVDELHLDLVEVAQRVLWQCISEVDMWHTV